MTLLWPHGAMAHNARTETSFVFFAPTAGDLLGVRLKRALVAIDGWRILRVHAVRTRAALAHVVRKSFSGNLISRPLRVVVDALAPNALTVFLARQSDGPNRERNGVVTTRADSGPVEIIAVARHTVEKVWIRARSLHWRVDVVSHE